jgi:hypothetical protein
MATVVIVWRQGFIGVASFQEVTGIHCPEIHETDIGFTLSDGRTGCSLHEFFSFTWQKGLLPGKSTPNGRLDPRSGIARKPGGFARCIVGQPGGPLPHSLAQAFEHAGKAGAEPAHREMKPDLDPLAKGQFAVHRLREKPTNLFAAPHHHGSSNGSR